MINQSIQQESLSWLGMGNMRLPVLGDDPRGAIDREKAQEIIDYAMSHGINYYDTAYVYHGGESEKFLGEAMKKYPREDYYLATKFFVLANPDYKAVFEEQLERLQTDYIDFYLIHGIFDNNMHLYLDGGCIDYFLEQKKAGRVKHLGFSSHASVDNLRTFADHHQWDFAQIQMNYFDWELGSAKEEYQILEERNIPIVVMEPVRGGRLAGLTPETEQMMKESHPDWSIASWAFRFVKSFPQVKVVLSGMSTMDQLKENIEIFSDDTKLIETEQALVFEAAKIFKSQLEVPCTSCRYCCDDCPVEINIPEYMELYNKFKVDGHFAFMGLKDLESKGKPEDCIACEKCCAHCPQDIIIPEILKELSQAMQNMPPMPRNEKKEEA